MTAPTTPSPTVAPAARNADDRQQMPRERSARTGGPRLKLNVFKEIPGFHLYWCNDEDAAIEQLLQDGFTFVTPEEAGMKSATNIVADVDLSDRVSKFVGTTDSGAPLRAYLMKCDNDLWREMQDESQTQADTWEGEILAGRIENVDNRYKPTGFDTKIVSGIRR